MSDLRILLSSQPPFIQGLAFVLFALLVIAAITVADMGLVRFAKWFRLVRARRYVDQIVRVEAQAKRLAAASRAGGRS